MIECKLYNFNSTTATIEPSRCKCAMSLPRWRISICFYREARSLSFYRILCVRRLRDGLVERLRAIDVRISLNTQFPSNNRRYNFNPTPATIKPCRCECPSLLLIPEVGMSLPRWRISTNFRRGARGPSLY